MTGADEGWLVVVNGGAGLPEELPLTVTIHGTFSARLAVNEPEWRGRVSVDCEPTFEAVAAAAAAATEDLWLGACRSPDQMTAEVSTVCLPDPRWSITVDVDDHVAALPLKQLQVCARSAAQACFDVLDPRRVRPEPDRT